MTLQQRYRQAAREARWALGLTILYMIGWAVCAYLPDNSAGPLGFPLWFELSCIYLPVLFIVVAYWLIKIVYQDIDLDISTEKDRTLSNSQDKDITS
ncbi:MULTISPECIES: YhdT family protein [unclassified Lonepinella]|uniref:YhdT family protein n=1 Tax=unclassified Lonepinella TaxID=2642006 RepID=UPI003F6DD26A